MTSTMKVTGKLKEGFRVDLQAGNHLMIIDQPKNAGGKDEGPNPLEVLLFALASCHATVAAIIAKQERINLRAFEIEIEGDIDKNFLMGKTKEGRAGFTVYRVLAHIDADLTEEEKRDFITRVGARCPATDNLINNSKIVVELK